MESANHNWNIDRSELTGEIERARELIGLDADQSDEPGPCRSDRADRPPDIDDRVALVATLDVYLDLRPQVSPGRTPSAGRARSRDCWRGCPSATIE